MNKKELIDAVAERTEMTKKEADLAITAAFEVIKNAVAEGDSVQLIGFGTFLSKERSARTARNPRTGEPIEIEAFKAPVFKAGKTFKDAVK